MEHIQCKQHNVRAFINWQHDMYIKMSEEVFLALFTRIFSCTSSHHSLTLLTAFFFFLPPFCLLKRLQLFLQAGKPFIRSYLASLKTGVVLLSLHNVSGALFAVSGMCCSGLELYKWVMRL